MKQKLERPTPDTEKNLTITAPGKKTRVTKKSKSNGDPLGDKMRDWPEYFHSALLFALHAKSSFKALNTVLAFVSSKRQLTTTFSAVRSSIEGLLKQALMPDLIRFSYIPKSELQTSQSNATQSNAHSGFDRRIATEDGHVLVLDFTDSPRGAKSKTGPRLSLTATTTISTAAVKKMIERRNVACQNALNDLLLATSVNDDPVSLLKTAGRDHIPVNPSESSYREEMINVKVPTSNERLSIAEVVAELQTQTWVDDQIIYTKAFDAKEALTGVLEPALSQMVSRGLLESHNITSFYSHQVAAIRAVQRGMNVVVSTSTASGKSVIYQVPLLTFLEKNAGVTAMFVYPTKARHLHLHKTKEVSTYDGDTPQQDRAGIFAFSSSNLALHLIGVIRESASVILTNFVSQTRSFLWWPRPTMFSRTPFMHPYCLGRKFVDELHYYSGVFGSHVAMIIRRFRRVCAAVGNRHIQFISCSATLANPSAHMEKMFGLDSTSLEVFTEDGSPSGRKDVLIWNPKLRDPKQPSLGRCSSISDAARVMRFLMKRGIRVILFCKAMKTIKADLTNEGRLDILDRVRPYRGGNDRRRIEQDAFSGALLGIVATNALELGIDIGALDAVIMLGFPMTISNFRQQSGRAGRRSRDSLSVLIADSFPIDQYYVSHPEELFDSKIDDLIIETENKIILEAHLQCAGNEMPLSPADEKWFGPLMSQVCGTQLCKDKDGWYHTHAKFLPYPSRHVSIRGVTEDKYIVVEVQLGQPANSSSLIEEVEISRALFEIYEGGIFMHQGSTFIITEVNHDAKLVKTIRKDVNYITSPRQGFTIPLNFASLTVRRVIINRDFTNVDALQTRRIRAINANRVYYGSKHSTSLANFVGKSLELEISIYVKIDDFYRHGVILDTVDLETLPLEQNTTGFWIDVPNTLLQLMQSKGINAAEAIHAAQHAFLNQFPLAEDIRTECKAEEKEYKAAESRRKRPARLIFYDAIGKGGCVTARAFDESKSILDKARLAIQNCQCENGCTRCVRSIFCKEGNKVCSKLGAELILKQILGLDINQDGIPYRMDPLPHNTIVEAFPVSVADGVNIEYDSSI
ncbi:hypothetical protein K443DRAFT_129904 [Laccaria amethystina LaAM-08-1]|uniref:Helicase C-terminal domain-containing protein n=1 Tax=Laccaria amethystina LaAM-08-1 TaxID=1095629 RepID=A0A0C9XN96_9AGAR|nr:hypothetical protein K443DRAFT_129904 [Laccaria amethystina LaAM-08-1]